MAGMNEYDRTTTTQPNQVGEPAQTSPPTQAGGTAQAAQPGGTGEPVTTGTAPQPGTSADDARIGGLVSQLSEEVSTLVRGELELARLELTQKAKHAGTGLGAFGAAGILALYGLGVLIATAILALALVLDAWLAALIVGVVILIVAGGIALFGKKQVSEGTPMKPERTTESVKRDVDAAKQHARPGHDSGRMS